MTLSGDILVEIGWMRGLFSGACLHYPGQLPKSYNGKIKSDLVSLMDGLDWNGTQTPTSPQYPLHDENA